MELRHRRKVIRASRDEHEFTVTLDDDESARCRKLLLATGVRGQALARNGIGLVEDRIGHPTGSAE